MRRVWLLQIFRLNNCNSRMFGAMLCSAPNWRMVKLYTCIVRDR